jgi:hypothetical protein
MPPRFRNVKRAFEQFGVEATPPTGGGSHWKLAKDGKTYPIPASHGDKTEIAEIYIRKACLLFGLDERELRKHL